MPSNKAANLIQEMASYYQAISTANGYFYDVVADGIIFGEESFNEKQGGDSDYPKIKIITNQLTIPEFSTKSCSKTNLEIIVHGYLRKEGNRETGLTSYIETLNWAKDLRDAFRAYLNGQDGGDVDADLENSEIQQQIGYGMNTVTVSSSFTLSFDEKLGE